MAPQIPRPKVAVAGLPARASAAPPVVVSQVDVHRLGPGTTLSVMTHSHTYTIRMQQTGRGMLTSNNPGVKGGMVVVHGSWDHDLESPVWGSVIRGKGLLFAHLPDVKDGTKTGPAWKVTIS